MLCERCLTGTTNLPPAFRSEQGNAYMIKRIINAINAYISSYLYTPKERIRKYGGSVGKGVFIGKDVVVDYDFAFLLEISDGAVISARSIIELHDSCLPNVLGRGENKVGRIRIGRRAYIGVNSVVLPGVEIGDGAIIGACSLVNRSIPNGQVWGGVPVAYLCTVNELAKKRERISEPGVANFNWIGELEKREVDYDKIRAKFIDEVRFFFEDKGG